MKTCAKCGLPKPLDNFRLVGGAKRRALGHRRSTCKRCEWRRAYQRRRSGTVSQVLTLRLRSQRTYDRQNGIDFDLDLDYLLAMYERQVGRCAATGLQMTLAFCDLCAVSIDRLDNDRGHVKGNVQLVCQWVNLAHKDHSAVAFNAVLLTFKRQIARHVLKRLRQS